VVGAGVGVVILKAMQHTLMVASGPVEKVSKMLEQTRLVAGPMVKPPRPLNIKHNLRGVNAAGPNTQKKAVQIGPR
jgi:hypothetical protein